MPIIMCGPGCTTETKNSGARCADPQQSYIGAVLGKGEHNWYDDSDFYAIVWDGERVTEEEYGSTRSWTYHNGAIVDATEEVQAAALAWYRERLGPLLVERARRDAAEPRKGKTVRSLTTRGRNAGIVGVIKWLGEDGYRSTRHHTFYRVGIAVEGESKLRFLPAERVEVVDPDEVDDQALLDVASRAKPSHWGAALSMPLLLARSV